MDTKALFLSFNGRINRGWFWVGIAFTLGASLIVQFIPVLGQLLGLGLMWPSCALYAKRLHDMGKSGMLLLFPVTVAILCMTAAIILGIGAAILSPKAHGFAAVGLAAGLPLLIMLLTGVSFLLWVGFTPGDPDDNVYGARPSPRDQAVV